jgi:hypothetical protein
MMNDSGGSEQGRQDEAGLCSRCLHVQVVVSARGSRFYLCRLSLTDPSFPRYPRIPVLTCAGFAARQGEGSDPGLTPV